MCGTEHMTTPRKAKGFARTWPDRLKAGWRAGEWHPLDRKRFWPHPIYRQQEAPNESTRRADSTRGLLRHALLHRQGPGKIEGLLCPNSWRESDQGGKSVLRQAG